MELLHQISENEYVVNLPVKGGLIQTAPGEAVLIDSGSDESAARKIRRALKEKGWNLKAVYLTHSNADHIGGCAYLQKQTGCRIFAPDIEACFTRHPLLEPAFLNGAYPHQDLRHKFLMAKPCCCEELTEENLPSGWKMLDLPGHFLQMTGYLTPGGTAWIADSLVAENTLEKYGISFLFDAGAYLDTLEKLPGLPARLFVPAHAPMTQDIAPLTQANKEAVLRIRRQIQDFLAEPHTTEQVIQHLFQICGLTMTMEQYALCGSTIRSYLSWMKDEGALQAFFDDCLLWWQAAGN